MASKEILGRFTHIVNLAEQDGIEPREYIRRIFRESILNKNPLINPDSKFVVLGIDGLSGDMFPSGSFDTKDEAFSCITQKKIKEHFYSDEEEISTTFHIFTREGTHVPSPEKVPPSSL